ncbi:MAG TPA: DUF4166 domain-containing protein [Chitinophagaceae bacterium]|nr:DUF4166 domain-containing protein [Chitinophagaceae bacterium]
MSIYKQYLGKDFDSLHPMMQQRFGIGSDQPVFMLGTGVMERIFNAGWHTLPFLYLGTTRNIMFPETGTNIPFTIENYGYRDALGRETVSWNRKFHFGKKIRRFDATMVYNEAEHRIIDYLGNKQHLAVDISMNVNADRSITIQSGNQRFYEGRVAFRYPDMFSGNAEVKESYDENLDRFNIQVTVRNKTFGTLFGYKGYFKAEFRPLEHGIPADARPLREEARY